MSFCDLTFLFAVITTRIRCGTACNTKCTTTTPGRLWRRRMPVCCLVELDSQVSHCTVQSGLYALGSNE